MNLMVFQCLKISKFNPKVILKVIISNYICNYLKNNSNTNYLIGMPKFLHISFRHLKNHTFLYKTLEMPKNLEIANIHANVNFVIETSSSTHLKNNFYSD